MAKPSLRPLVETLCSDYPELDLQILDGKASDIARVARAVITVSGTATLELLHYARAMARATSTLSVITAMRAPSRASAATSASFDGTMPTA